MHFKILRLFLGLVTKQLGFVGSIICQSVRQLLCVCMCLHVQPLLFDNVLCEKGHLRCKGQDVRFHTEENTAEPGQLVTLPTAR